MSDLAEIQRSLGRVEGKLDTLIAQQTVQDDRATELEIRMRKVESKQHLYAGVAAAVGSIIAYLLPRPHL